jgi:mRNA-degrading endonuclease toxin of MazEF toxin-antitoxin module
VKAPQRGEVWLVDLDMAAKVRPAVVMSIPAADVDRALVTIVPHTTSGEALGSKQLSRCLSCKRASSTHRIL